MNVVFQSVSKTIHKVPVLENITLEMESGLVYGLRGKNGSGKTMLMRAFCGLIRPTRGTIYIEGKQLGKDISFPPSIGALLETPAFLPRETATKNLAILNELSDEQVAPNEIETVLVQVGLDPNDRRPYRKFSLGMKQRLGIAAAILGSPRIVVLDEPTNALDADGIVLLRKICDDLKTKGCLVMLSCHDAEELHALCDVIFSVSEGRIISRACKNDQGEWAS